MTIQPKNSLCYLASTKDQLSLSVTLQHWYLLSCGWERVGLLFLLKSGTNHDVEVSCFLEQVRQHSTGEYMYVYICVHTTTLRHKECIEGFLKSPAIVMQE